MCSVYTASFYGIYITDKHRFGIPKQIALVRKLYEIHKNCNNIILITVYVCVNILYKYILLLFMYYIILILAKHPPSAGFPSPSGEAAAVQEKNNK